MDIDKRLINKYAKEALKLTFSLAQINSHAENLEGISEVINKLIPLLQVMGFDIEVIDNRNIFAKRVGSGKKIVMLGHMDTAFEKNSSFKDIWIENNILHGPGVSDMKGGIALMFSCLSYLHFKGLLRDREIGILLNSDEECGSFLSRDLIYKKSKDYELALIFEGGNRIDEQTTTYLNTRQGSGNVSFGIHGKTASIALNPQDGVSAAEEMAFKMAETAGLSDFAKKTVININGDIGLGSYKKGSIPDFAHFGAEFRYSFKDELKRIKSSFEDLAKKHFVKNIHGETPITHLDFKIHRPAMIACDEALFYSSLFEKSAEEMGYKIIQKSRTGGSDGCLTSDAGTPTIDGVGPVGGKWHTSEEYLEIDSLGKRLELLIRFLDDISGE